MSSAHKCHPDWFLRVALASVFLFHGAIKFPILSDLSAMMGMPVWLLALAGAGEIIAALLILLGGLKRKMPILDILGGAILVVMMSYAAYLHKGQWNFLPSATHPNGGMEFQVTLILISLYFVSSAWCRMKCQKSKELANEM